MTKVLQGNRVNVGDVVYWPNLPRMCGTVVAKTTHIVVGWNDGVQREYPISAQFLMTRPIEGRADSTPKFVVAENFRPIRHVGMAPMIRTVVDQLNWAKIRVRNTHGD